MGGRARIEATLPEERERERGVAVLANGWSS